ncbi:MAG: hypothetical protein GQ532_09940 [Methylomarinum sp.]|nr:hypothetical protein [Methylomarinum sp.]
MSSIVNSKQACEILGCNCKSQVAFRLLKNRADFPLQVNQGVVRGRLWKRADIVSFKDHLKTGAIDPLIPAINHHFLTGKFDTKNRKLQAMSQRVLARLNKHKTISVRVNGERV